MKYFGNLLKNLDRQILALIGVLAVISVVMIASVSWTGEFQIRRDMIVQTTAYLLGLGAVFFLVFIDYKAYCPYEKQLYIGSLLFLLLVYVPGLGHEQYSALSWIKIPGIPTTIQPSEFVKISFVLLMAMFLSRNRNNLSDLKGVAMAFLYGAPFILIVLKEDLGSAIVFGAIWISMVFYAGIDYKLFAKCAGAVALMMPIVFLFMADHQKMRIVAFLHPDDLTIEATRQVFYSKVAIGSGGFFGKGLFQGVQKQLEFIPVAKSDFIFAVVCEELGMLGACILIILFSVLLLRFARVARDAIDLYGALIAVGFVGMFGFQIFENIAMTMGIMPVTGITLPFISYGGSSTLACMMATGLALSVGMRSKQINF